ncbi:MAG: hypothetical protein EAX96_17365 [Candidatus Lokiarchaeota archaeon]|nr:hypothetical protein [Candidatus Lokiarchaeota archaeon]
MQLSKKNISRISILIAACLMGSVGLFVDLLSQFNEVSISFFRSIIGFIFLTIFLLAKKEIKNVKLLVKKPKWLILLGTTNAFCILFYFFAINLTNFAEAAFLLYSGNVFAIIFFKLLLHEEVRKINVVSFILATVGLLFISEFQINNLNFGLLFGLLSGILLGLNITSIKKFMQDDEVENFSVSWWAILFASSIFVIPSVPQFILINYINIFIIIGLGLIPTAIAFSLYNKGIKEDDSGDILILAYAEPLVATLLTIFYQNIIISLYVLIGGILILLGNLIVLLSKRTGT